MNQRIGLLIVLLSLTQSAVAEVYECPVIKKLEIVTDYRYSPEELRKLGLVIRLVVNEDAAAFERCRNGAPGSEPVCQTYTVDYISRDPDRGSTKFYAFDAQIELQLFRDLVILENDGRGAAAMAACGPLG